MMNKMIEFSMAAVLAAAVTGQLPKLVYRIRVAQIQILKDSQTSKWGKPFLPKPVAR